MSNNTYKKSQGSGNGKRGFFAFLENAINVEKYFDQGLPTQYLMPILFITALCIFYIGNLHFAEKNIRKISKLKVEVEDLRADFTTLKAEYNFTSKQSEVARKAAKLGLKESINPPFKLIVDQDEF
jgi:hypothetical protein